MGLMQSLEGRRFGQLGRLHGRLQQAPQTGRSRGLNLVAPGDLCVLPKPIHRAEHKVGLSQLCTGAFCALVGARTLLQTLAQRDEAAGQRI